MRQELLLDDECQERQEQHAQQVATGRAILFPRAGRRPR